MPTYPVPSWFKNLFGSPKEEDPTELGFDPMGMGVMGNEPSPEAQQTGDPTADLGGNNKGGDTAGAGPGSNDNAGGGVGGGGGAEGDRLGGVHRTTKQKTTNWTWGEPGTAGPGKSGETAIFIPDMMKKLGLQGRERDVVDALREALKALEPPKKAKSRGL
jgi:hypothetical protein